MDYKSTFSSNNEIVAAVEEIKQNLSEVSDPGLIVYFASSLFSVDAVSRLMAEAFPMAQTIGCSAFGEMVSNKMLTGSIVALACGRRSIPRLKIEGLENIKENKQAVSDAFEKFEKYFQTPMSKLFPSRYVGLLLVDGQSKCEEYINDQIGNLTNVVFIGGSAGTKIFGDPTYIFVNGKTYSNAAALVLMEPVNGFAFLKTQSLALTEKKITPTKVDEASRIVYEFNHRPATEAYADILNLSVAELPSRFTTNPLALVMDETLFYVRDPHRILDHGAIEFFCAVKEGVELTVLQARDIVADTRRDLENTWYNNRNLNAIIEFNCVSRMNELREKQQGDEYAALFKSIPTISFASFGESYILHMNQSSTMLLLK